MKKVSVIIPLYNQSEFLIEAVESVTASTYSDIEIIVVNDGSTDITKENLSKILAKFDNVRLFNRENSGVCNTRNYAINQAAGDYILPLDADDKIASDYIEKAVNILDSNSDIGVVYCDVEYFGDITAKANKKTATEVNMLIENRIFPSAMFRKNEFIQTSGYRQEMILGCEDWDLWLSFMENGVKFHKIDEVLFFYRKHSCTRTSRALKFSNYLRIRLNIIKNHKSLYKKYWFKVLLPLMCKIIKNLLYNIKNYLFYFKKFLRRIYYKTAINIFNLYPNIKRINKTQKQNEIEKFLQSNDVKNSIVENLIVSLTSIPERMYDIHYTLYSLVTQSIKPEKIILYLGKDKFPNGEKDLPESVLVFKNFGLSIEFVDDLRSFTKLLPALEAFPNNVIVTADDDIFYERNWLESLYCTHLKYPEEIVVHKHLNIKTDDSKNPLTYRNWTDTIENQASLNNFLLGVGGVLYPPDVFYDDVKNSSIFLKLCRHNDDVWFWAMARLKGTKIRIADNPIPKQTLINVERELNLNNEMTLYKGNRVNRTDVEFMNVINYYDIRF